MCLFRVYLCILHLCLFSLYSTGQQNESTPFLKVNGEVTKPLTLYMDDLTKMKRNTVTMKERDGKMQKYTGVSIQEILELAGVTMGTQLRGENLTKYLLVKCSDGYEVLFSLAEIDSSFTERNVIIAYESEGKSLPSDTGPFKLVVPGEKKPARSSFQVTEFVIRFAKD